MDMFSFKKYIEDQETKDNDETKDKLEFKNMLGEDIKKIPYNISSSKYLLKLLNLNSRKQYDLFSRVYLNYYRRRLRGDTLN